MADRASMPTFVPRTVAFVRANGDGDGSSRGDAGADVGGARAVVCRSADGQLGGAGPTVGGFDGGVRPRCERRRARRDAAAAAVVRGRRRRECNLAAAGGAGRDGGAAAERRADGGGCARDGACGPGGRARRGDCAHGADGGARAGGARCGPAGGCSGDAATSRRGEDDGGGRERDGGGEREASEARRETAAIADVRVAEALGLHAPLPAPQRDLAPEQRATTPLGRALAHAAWVDTQLRAVTTPAHPWRARRRDTCSSRRPMSSPTTTARAGDGAGGPGRGRERARAGGGAETVRGRRGERRRRRALLPGRRACPIRSWRRRCRPRSRSG